MQRSFKRGYIPIKNTQFKALIADVLDIPFNKVVVPDAEAKVIEDLVSGYIVNHSELFEVNSNAIGSLVANGIYDTLGVVSGQA